MPRKSSPRAPPPDLPDDAAVAVTVTVPVAVPPGPVHARLYVVVAANTTLSGVDELVALLPDQFPPEAMQLVALVDVQDNWTDDPVVALLTLEVTVTVGAGGVLMTEYS